jgi:tetratricopeptide (TPR) repeat protein
MSMAESPLEATGISRDADLSGRRIGDYELIRRLGRGGMADVYLARQLSLGRHVAFKVLRSHLAADEKYVRRFQQEARAAAALVHANIVQIHEVGYAENVHYIVQEYVPGQNLRQYLQKHGPLDARMAVRVIRQVAAALHRSSQQNIIHRDIKPENIMLASTGEVKVADFGLARIVQNGQGLEVTQVGVTMGTPLYMSPEQVEGRPVDPRSDIYSLGVTCFHMLTGRPPFEGDSPLAVAVQHLQQEPPRLESLRPDLPPALCQIVHRMMAKDPSQRYQTAADILKDLRRLGIDSDDWSWEVDAEPALEEPGAAEAVSLSAATQQLATVLIQQRTMERLTRWVQIAVVALALVGFGVGAVVAWVQRREDAHSSAPAASTEVPRMESARLQYIYACLQGTDEALEKALKSVEKYFPYDAHPENRLYVFRSWQRLGELYLLDGQWQLALQQYQRLADLADDTELYFRALGLVGQAAALSRMNERQATAARLTEATPLLEKLSPLERQAVLALLDPELRREVVRLQGERVGRP